MRRNLFGGLGLSISVFLGALSLASLASAQATTTPATPSAHAQLLKTLRQAHHLLVNADHDYDGHRAKAAEEVHKAIKELEGKHHGKKAQSATTPSTGGIGPRRPARGAKAKCMKPRQARMRSCSRPCNFCKGPRRI